MDAVTLEGTRTRVDWHEVVHLMHLSRALDRIEEEDLVPAGLITYQFSSRGHELAQVLLGLALDHPHDAAGMYYRSRPFVLTAGLSPEDALAATMGRVGGPNEGRDIGVVHSLVPRGRATVLPVSGDVGAQYTPTVGWANAIHYRVRVMGDDAWRGAAAAALGGDGSVATPGFWAALNIATTEGLPMLFFVEDNGYAISVPSVRQTPGGNIAANLAAYDGLRVLDGDGTDPEEASDLIGDAVGQLRRDEGPVLLRLRVPRLSGHSFADNQAYKSDAELQAEQDRDPLDRLRAYLVPDRLTQSEWDGLQQSAEDEVASAADNARSRPQGPPAGATRYVFFEADRPQDVGGPRPEGAQLSPEPYGAADPGPVRINMVDAIRQTLIDAMEASDRVLVFGEDVGEKGGVHGLTRDMQSQFGPDRVFDTPLTEEGIIGRSVGLALAGLVPVPEIQFRKYADPATEQLNDCGTIRWRTAGHFAAPVVVRIPVGFSRATGDPWHSVTGESVFAHSVGWRIAFPSNAEDAVGLLRTALRGDDPTYFLEHRALYDNAVARRPYPGPDYALPFGQGQVVQSGDQLSVITWGAFVHRVLEALKSEGLADLADRVEVVDLRTIVPWDKALVLESVKRTGRCLVVHEDNWTAGFGAEVAATVADEAFMWLDAPVERVASADCPVPYSPQLMTGVVPTAEVLAERIEALLAF